MKRLETLDGEFIFPLVSESDSHGKPPSLDDQHHIDSKNPHPPREEGGKDLFNPVLPGYAVGEIDEFFGDLFDPPLEDAETEAAREGEPQPPTEAKGRALRLDDVPHSIKKNLATVWAPSPPYGYVWNGECLVKTRAKTNDCIDHSTWRNMSENKGLRLWLKNERKVQAEYEAAIKAVPATPVLNGNREERRGRLLSLDNKKPLEGLLSSQRLCLPRKLP